MSPGGHLVTTVAACAASVVLTRNLPMADTVALAGGIAAGGFLIDVDHAIDYVFVEGQRDLRPSAFLNYYVEGRMRRTVLALHSYELFAVLIAAMLWLNCLPLTGYVLGALMHLTLDLMFNAELTPRSITAFYSFTYRAAHRFEAVALLGRGARKKIGRQDCSEKDRENQCGTHCHLNLHPSASHVGMSRTNTSHLSARLPGSGTGSDRTAFLSVPISTSHAQT